jgi:TRAP-type transport system periplasmic protein
MTKTLACVLGMSASIGLAGSPGAAAAPLELKLATIGVPTSYFYVGALLPWAEKVSRDSGGTIEVRHFGGGVLANATNMLDAVMDGAVDIGWVTTGSKPALLAKSSVVELPFLHDNSERTSAVMWRLYQKGVLATDYQGLQVFAFPAWPVSALATRTKPILKADDLKGLKIGSQGKLRSDILSALGAVPVNTQFDEAYTALDKGVIEGLFTPHNAAKQARLAEVARRWLTVPLSGGAVVVVMKKERYEQLPAQARAAFEKNSGGALSRALGKTQHDYEAGAIEFIADLAKQGKVMPRYYLSEAEGANWQKLVTPVVREWTKRTPNGEAVLAAFRSEMTAVRAGK